MILFSFAQNHPQPIDSMTEPQDSAPAVFTRTADAAETADMTFKAPGARESATSVDAEIEQPILWVEMGFDMGYVY